MGGEGSWSVVTARRTVGNASGRVVREQWRSGAETAPRNQGACLPLPSTRPSMARRMGVRIAGLMGFMVGPHFSGQFASIHGYARRANPAFEIRRPASVARRLASFRSASSLNTSPS